LSSPQNGAASSVRMDCSCFRATPEYLFRKIFCLQQPQLIFQKASILNLNCLIKAVRWYSSSFNNSRYLGDTLYIVTCQPIVGLGNSGCDPLLSDSSVNRFPRTHDDVIPGVGKCHVLTWLPRDIPRWRHSAPAVGEYHVTSTFPQVTSYTLQLRPLPRNVAVNNLPRNNMGRCVFCGRCRGVILKTNGATEADYLEITHRNDRSQGLQNIH
jgi:hypothetical protein